MGVLRCGPRAAMTAMVVLVLIGSVAVTEAQRRSRPNRQCWRPPSFTLNGQQPLETSRGRVLVVAFLTSTCPFCIQQASKMEMLYTSLGSGAEVDMMIINGGPRPAPGQSGVFERMVSFRVLHGNDNHQLWNDVFRAGKDDIQVFDRCGVMTYHLTLPYSMLDYPFLTRAIQRTRSRNICSCSSGQSRGRQRSPRRLQDRMLADAPMQSVEGPAVHRRGYGGRRQPDNLQNGSRVSRRQGGRARSPNRRMNRSRCVDDLCRQMRRGRRQYNRFRSQHQMGGSHSQRDEEELLRMFAGRRFSGNGLQPAA